ncbi:MAG: DNA-3-methyladenine glycosylase family protein [Actinomycetota bacterium]
MKARTVSIDVPLDLRLTLRVLREGAGDPCLRLTPTEALRTTRTPDGLATLHLALSGTRLEGRAWGPGAGWLLEHLDDLVGLHDDGGNLRPAHRLVRELHLRLAGMRLGRTLRVFEALLPAILGQRVTGEEATRSYRALVRRYGDPAPGPIPLMAPPSPELLAGLGYYELHPLGIERRRAGTILRAAAEAPRLERLVETDATAARRRLEAIAGVGAWTSAHVARTALGDPDAVVVGDWNLPHTVAYALAGEERATDERMLELLAPYAGQRGRVQRLIATGCGWAPRRGPKHRMRNFART